MNNRIRHGGNTPNLQKGGKKDSKSIMAEMQQVILEAKTNWVDAWMRRLLPADVYELANGASGGDRKTIRRWMVDNKLELREFPDRTELWVGEKRMGDFKIELKQGTLNFMSKDYTEEQPPEPPVNN